MPPPVLVRFSSLTETGSAIDADTVTFWVASPTSPRTSRCAVTFWTSAFEISSTPPVASPTAPTSIPIAFCGCSRTSFAALTAPPTFTSSPVSVTLPPFALTVPRPTTDTM